MINNADSIKTCLTLCMSEQDSLWRPVETLTADSITSVQLFVQQQLLGTYIYRHCPCWQQIDR